MEITFLVRKCVETWWSAMISDPTSWDCLLDRYLGSDRGTGSQVAAPPNTCWGFSSGMVMPVWLCLRNITPSKLPFCCTFQQSHFGHGWLEPWSILCKRHNAIYCICKWCLLIEISQCSSDPMKSLLFILQLQQMKENTADHVCQKVKKTWFRN